MQNCSLLLWSLFTLPNALLTLAFLLHTICPSFHADVCVGGVLRCREFASCGNCLWFVSQMKKRVWMLLSAALREAHSTELWRAITIGQKVKPSCKTKVHNQDFEPDEGVLNRLQEECALCVLNLHGSTVCRKYKTWPDSRDTFTRMA